MKKLIAILFALTMLLQAIPVLHFFSDKPEVFYTAIDEEKPEGKSDSKLKKSDDQSLISVSTALSLSFSTAVFFPVCSDDIPSSPYLQMLTPPPDAA